MTGIDDNFFVVAIGRWHYDGITEKDLELWRKSASHAHSRFINDGETEPYLDETRPIPNTPDGMIYMLDHGIGGEFTTMLDAMQWANSQPWGPVAWEVLAAPRPRTVRSP